MLRSGRIRLVMVVSEAIWGRYEAAKIGKSSFSKVWGKDFIYVFLADLNIRNISFLMIFSVGGLINFLGGYSLWSQSCTFSIEYGNFDPGDSLRSYDKCQMARRAIFNFTLELGCLTSV